MLDQERLPGAVLDDRGRWQVPIADLETLGYNVDVSLLEGPATDSRVEKLQAEVHRLREKLAVAEALAEERGRVLDALTATIDSRRRR